jgi:putative colanic acid biosynthesis UDP-glucose lipid carrier transferase
LGFKAGLAGADIGICSLAYLLTGLLFDGLLASFGAIIQLALVLGIGIGFVLIHMSAGGYTGRCLQRPRPAMAIALLALTANMIVAAVLIELSLPGNGGVTANFWLVWWVGAASLLTLVKGQVPTLVEIGLQQGFLGRRLAVVGPINDEAGLIAELEAPGPGFPCRVISLIQDPGSDRPVSASFSAAMTGQLNDLRSLTLTGGLDAIVLQGTVASPGWPRRIMRALQPLPADILLIGPRADEATDHIGIVPAMRLAVPPFQGLARGLKWAMDKSIALGAIVFLAPLMLLIALLVRLDSRGPALYRQTRLGYLGKPYQILKFRSMTVDQGDDGTRRMHQKHRITRLGRMLRSSSLDELPQLFNVLRGDMSIVGPRPHVPNETVGDARYIDLEPDYLGRLRAKPGLTGWATVNGSRGGIFTPEKARRAVELDEYYLTHASIWLDVRIMLRTSLYLLGGDVR